MHRRDWLRGSIGAAFGAGVSGALWQGSRAWGQDNSVPDEILNPVEVYGAKAVPVVGKLPGEERMYMLPNDKGEYHRVGSFVMKRIARPQENKGTYELMTFAGPAGSAMPTHVRLASHAALLVMEGDIEVYLDGRAWRMIRGDFANVPPNVTLGWTMRSDRSRLALFTMGDRAGAAFVGMGQPASSAAPATIAIPITAAQLARASLTGDFQLRQNPPAAGEAQRVTNKTLPDGVQPYVIADDGGQRNGGNTFRAMNRHTNGQFLFLMTEGVPGPGIGAHFHARHTEDFFALDGETLGWANGQAVSLHTGDFFHAPPRNLHGFKFTQPYNRFVGFLTPGIFESFFTRGRSGGEGPRGQGAPPQGGPPGAAPPRANPRPGDGDPAVDVFRALSNAGRGPDGYPLDVHGATKPLPKEDPIWKQGRQASAKELKFAYMQHAYMCAGSVGYSEPMSAELAAALKFKPKAEDFI